MSPVARGGTDTSEEARAFLQQRLAMLGASQMALLSAFLVVSNTLFTLLDPRFPWRVLLSATANQLALAVVSIMTATWLYARGKPRSMRALRNVDMFVAYGCGLIFIVIGSQHMIVMHRDMTTLLSLVGLSLGRTFVLPSSARRSLLLTAPLVPIAALAVYFRHRAEGSSEALLAGVSTLIWASCTAGMSAAASGVIFGLRRKVRDMTRLGQYRLLDKLGEGGMGAVYRAEHALLKRATAIKLIRPEVAGEPALKRFEREVQLTSQLSHPNIVTVYDYGRTIEGVFYYAMEYLPGVDLERLVAREGPQPASRVVHVVTQLAAALGEAHRHGLVHRDVKPGNAMLRFEAHRGDTLTLVDFGLVKPLSRDAQLTGDGNVAGTPAYLPPEAITAPDLADGRGDIYAVGAVAYFMLTGSPPFTGKTTAELCAHAVFSTPMSPSVRLNAPVPAALEQLVLDCLEKIPDRRPRTMEDVLARLAAIEVPPWKATDAEPRWTNWDDAPTNEVALAETIDVEHRSGERLIGIESIARRLAVWG